MDVINLFFIFRKSDSKLGSEPSQVLLSFFGYGTLSGKMLLVMIVKNNKIDAYFILFFQYD